jgi:hypothetical protein
VTLLVLLALLEGGNLIVVAGDDALPAGGGVTGQLVLRAAGRQLVESAGEFLVGAGGVLPVGAGTTQLHLERLGRWHGRCRPAVVTGRMEPLDLADTDPLADIQYETDRPATIGVGGRERGGVHPAVGMPLDPGDGDVGLVDGTARQQRRGAAGSEPRADGGIISASVSWGRSPRSISRCALASARMISSSWSSLIGPVIAGPAGHGVGRAGWQHAMRRPRARGRAGQAGAGCERLVRCAGAGR